MKVNKKKHKTLEQRRRHSEIMKKKWAEKNSALRSNETIEKKSQKMKNHWKNKNSKLNKSERSEKISKKQKETWSNNNYRIIMSDIMKNLRNDENSIYSTEEYIKKHKKSYTKEVRKQMSKKVKKAWDEDRLGNDKWKIKRIEFMKNGGAAHCNRFIKNPSTPQVKLFELCQDILPYPIMNYPCLNYSIDIAVPILNLAIEYDGSYWHQNKESDKIRQKELEKEGWSFLRYTDYVPSKKELLEGVNLLEDFKNDTR